MKVDDPNTIKVKGNKKKIVYSLDWTAQAYEDRLACVKNLESEGLLNDLNS